MPPSEEEFLAEINADLPAGVDWKQGAIEYLRQLVLDGGPEVERFHLTKPFLGGPDFDPFWVDVFHFLDVVHTADLPIGSRVLDVGCGPGWTLHWMCKLGYEVTGIDISVELLEIAERRMASDPYPPYVGQPFRYDLRAHDIEATPVGLAVPADLALFESTLHHFHDPVSALRNVAADLAPTGLLAVVEAAAPPVGSTWHTENLRIMERYRTIERPYTREQLYDLLELAGFGHARVFRPVNGLYAQNAEALNQLDDEVGSTENINVVFAATNAEALARVAPHTPPLARLRQGWEPLTGFSPPEARADGSRYRWAQPRATLRCHSAGAHRLHVGTVDLDKRQRQAVHVVADGAIQGRVELTRERPAADLVVHASRPGAVVELQSDRVFSPGWSGAPDHRVLSFTVDVP